MAIVLKSDAQQSPASPARHVTGLAGFNLNDLADEGRRQLEASRRQAGELLERARREADELRLEAERRGYQEGCRKAEADFQEKLRSESERCARDQLGSLRKAVEQLHRQYESWMQQYAELLTTTGLAAAERIVGTVLERERELIVRWAEQALRSTRSATQLTLAVHPETLAELGQSLDELLASPDFPEQTHVEPDESVAPGDVVVRQTGGEIRAGLTAQLERLREALA